MENTEQKNIIAILEKILANQELQIQRQFEAMDLQKKHLENSRPLLEQAKKTQQKAQLLFYGLLAITAVLLCLIFLL